MRGYNRNYELIAAQGAGTLKPYTNSPRKTQHVRYANESLCVFTRLKGIIQLKFGDSIHISENKFGDFEKNSGLHSLQSTTR